jgi:hypothetical protein
MIEIQCSECDGTGYEEVIGDCDLPASMCCGGCSKIVACEICEGTGIINEEVDEYEDEY